MDWNDVVQLVLGGSGVTVLVALGKLLKDRREGKLMREDTAITRYKDLAVQSEKGAEKAWRLVSWYRSHYPLLWAEYMHSCGTPADRDRFPPAPPEEIDT